MRFNNSAGLKTPFSVIIPAIRFAGVTSNAGFQQLIPGIKYQIYKKIFTHTILITSFFDLMK